MRFEYIDFSDPHFHDRLHDQVMQRRHRARYPGFEQHPTIHPTSNMDALIPYVNYRDDRYATAQVVFDRTRNAAKFQSLQWDYSDRLIQWSREKHKAAHAFASSQIRDGRTVKFWDHYIKHYFDGQRELAAIATGWNHATLYTYYVFGTRACSADAAPTTTEFNSDE